MAPYNPAVPTTAPRPMYGTPISPNDFQAPAGTFAPGTKIQVGSQKVVIQKYFSEGGFAHVYLVKMPQPIDGTDIAILKRVAVPDKEHLANMRTEVETMKKLKGHRPIVTYYDSYASQLKGGGYEVFLLMEFCNGGGLIDFMNTRLQNRLTEPEILDIFSDVAEGVACMHYLKPPLLHRDLKVENVLITNSRGTRRFKLCDFGSTAPPRPAASTAAECRLIEEDVRKHTTPQYRSPEMVDVYRKLSIDEKSDIWALGVLLYKLCFYTTPFEDQGQLAILNASYKFPGYPHFSDNLKSLIASMLKESPQLRPNIYQVLKKACLMRGTEVPINDIYAEQSSSEARNSKEPLNSNHVSLPTPIIGAVFSSPSTKQSILPEIAPMRRGRPPKDKAPKSNRSPILGATNDPWAALDSMPQKVIDEASTRFPSLEQFSLLNDGGKFDFDKNSTDSPQDLNKRVTEKLADDAFAIQVKPSVSKAQEIISNNPELQSASTSTIYQTVTPFRSQKSSYVSQGTMTLASLCDSTTNCTSNLTSCDHHCAVNVSRKNSKVPLSQHDSILPKKSILASQSSIPSRSSIESIGQSPNESPSCSKSINNHARPAAAYLESNIEFLREKELINRAATQVSSNFDPNVENSSSSSDVDEITENTHIKPSISLLRQPEIESKVKGHRRCLSGSKIKRTSIPSLSGTKTLLTGKFGDVFKRFENNISHQSLLEQPSSTPSPLITTERDCHDVTPSERSEVTSNEASAYIIMHEESILDVNTEKLPPEQRRELERRRLSIEEKRVIDAAAEYRKKVAEREISCSAGIKSTHGVSRATTIQNKVRSLLDETQHKTLPLKKTAAGYGRFTESESIHSSVSSANPYASAISSASVKSSRSDVPGSGQALRDIQENVIYYGKTRSMTPVPTSTVSKIGGSRPNAPPKPYHLNHMITGTQGTVKAYVHHSSLPRNDNNSGSANETSSLEKEDFLTDFSKRFPSLSGIEMVEREINARTDDDRIGKKLDASRSSAGNWGCTDRSSIRSKDV